MSRIKEILIEEGFECNQENFLISSNPKEVILTGRIKTVTSSLYNLLAMKNGKSQDLNDMIGIMVICEDKETCYQIKDLLIKKLELDGDKIIKYKDLIDKPKPNGYQSIHLNVDDTKEFIFEIQIKSYKMFAYSQTGERRHKKYKSDLVDTGLDEEGSIVYHSLREEFWF